MLHPYLLKTRIVIYRLQMMNIGLITNQEEAPFKAFGSTKFYRDREWNNIKSEIGSTVNQLTESMQKSITKPSEVEKDNW